jgi:TonB-linked SusC/RagA family outer membrane protein
MLNTSVMIRSLLFLCILLVTIQAYCQEKTISGKVVSKEDGSPIPGVNVQVKGTTLGTATNEEGNYQLTVSSNDVVLSFSFIGFKTTEIQIGARTIIDVILEVDATQLSEVIVVGYGTQIKQELTGNISKISGAEIQNVPTPSVESALQGRAAGVYINQGSGKLGGGIQIRVRGASSVSAGNQPLYIVDGIIINSSDLGSANNEPLNPIADINPNDIQSIEILKDASASAIYGSRASNGVVIITTKKGSIGNTKINFGYYVGVSTPTRKAQFLNAAQYRELFTAASVNMGYNPADEFAGNTGTDDWNNNYNTKWSDEPFQSGAVSQYELSASGGDKKTRFFMSLNYNDQKGIIIGNEFSRASGRINLDHSISEKFIVGSNISLTKSINHRVSEDNAFSNPIQLNALPPLHPKYDPATGQLNKRTLYYNALLNQKYGFDIANTYRSISNIYLNYSITPALVFRTEHGIDFLNLQEEVYLGKETQDGAPSGYGYNNQFTSANYTTNNTIAYNKIIGVHKIEALVGISYQQSQSSAAAVEGRGYPNDKFKKIASAAQITSGVSSGSEYRFLSYFFRGNYVLSGKYLFSASIRTDGSSRFGKDHRYGVFPAASAGWILTEESFLSENSTLSFLKLRISYGLTGNAEIGDFASRGQYQAGFYEDQSGIVPFSLASPNLRWEKTAQFDIGFDFGFLNDRITGEIDYYSKNTKDLLLNVPKPATNGFTSVTKNIGKLYNKGFELVINSQNLIGNLKWSTSFNIARNVNKVTDLNGAIIFGGERFIGQIRENEPMAVFYGPKYAGVDPANGDALYYTNEGSDATTNDYGSAASQKVGDPNPEFFGGIDNKLSFKGFDFSVLLQFVYGNDLYNIAGFFQSVNGDYFDNQTIDQMDYWKQPGDRTTIPQPRLYESNGSGKSSRWVQDGSFLRVKSVSLGYNVPKEILARTFISSARVYLATTNLFTFTKYKGYDPEVNSAYFGRSNVTLGHDFYTPPLAKTITFGFTVGL